MARKIWPFMSKRKPKVQQPTLAKLEENLRTARDNLSYAVRQGWNYGGYEAAVEVAKHHFETARRDLEAVS